MTYARRRKAPQTDWRVELGKVADEFEVPELRAAVDAVIAVVQVIDVHPKGKAIKARLQDVGLNAVVAIGGPLALFKKWK